MKYLFTTALAVLFFASAFAQINLNVSLAGQLGYTPRHLNRVLTDAVGAGPLALARAHRATTARTLIETTNLSFV